MLWKIVIFFVASAATTTSVWGLQCYNCDSRNQEECTSITNGTNITAVNCTALGGDTCVAYQATVANVTFTSRTCAPSSSGKPCTIIEATLVGLGGSIQDCYTCQTDYCNSSNSLTGASILVALAIVFQLFFSKS